MAKLDDDIIRALIFGTQQPELVEILIELLQRYPKTKKEA
jgi:hypothetical protein